jgi:hypothetical protein
MMQQITDRRTRPGTTAIAIIAPRLSEDPLGRGFVDDPPPPRVDEMEVVPADPEFVDVGKEASVVLTCELSWVVVAVTLAG